LLRRHPFVIADPPFVHLLDAFEGLFCQALIRKGVAARKELGESLRAYARQREVPLWRFLRDAGRVSEAELARVSLELFGCTLDQWPTDSTARARWVQRVRKARLAVRAPIWLQLSVAASLITLVTVALISYFSLGQQRDQLYQQSVKLGTVSLQYFANQARIPLLRNDELTLNSLVGDAKDVEGLLYAFITDHQGVVRAHTDLDRVGSSLEDFRNAGRVGTRGTVNYFAHTLPSGDRALNLNQPVMFKDKRLGQVHVGVSIDFMNEVVERERRTLLLMIVPTVGVGLVIAVIVGLWFSRPITRLVGATREIARGNYQHRIDLKRRDELGSLAEAFNHMGSELLRKEMMDNLFGKYVGREVVELVMAHPQDEWLRSHRCQATILFADIRGFTRYAEGRTPETVVAELNTIFEIVTTVISRHGGTVDKFIGDAVLAVFGVPIFHDDHVLRGLRAAVAMQQALSARFPAEDALGRALGVSLHTGLVLSGNIGSHHRFEYTVIGDTVNVAARINNLAGPGEIIITQDIVGTAGNLVEAAKLPRNHIRGRREPVEVYRLTGLQEGVEHAAAN
jgi:adenylate cyclase